MADERDLIRRLAVLLDACVDDLDRAAEAERRREEGKALRAITCQRRAEAAHKAIAEAKQLVGDF